MLKLPLEKNFLNSLPSGGLATLLSWLKQDPVECSADAAVQLGSSAGRVQSHSVKRPNVWPSWELAYSLTELAWWHTVLRVEA